MPLNTVILGKVITWDGTGTSYKTVKFWDAYCPKYNWVTGDPELSTGHTASTFDNLKKIKVNQFAFMDSDNDATTFTSSMFYHCLVNIYRI